MGLNIGINAITSGSLFITTLFLLLQGILLVTAHNKVEEIDGFAGNDELETIRNRLRWAYILTFIVAGLALVLMVAYTGHEKWWTPSEWVHTALFVIAVLLLAIAVILAFTSLTRLNVPEFTDVNNADSYIWASLLLGLFTFIGLLATGTGRAGYNSMRASAADRINQAEEKVHQIHDKVVKRVDEFRSQRAMDRPLSSMMSRPQRERSMRSSPRSMSRRQSPTMAAPRTMPRPTLEVEPTIPVSRATLM